MTFAEAYQELKRLLPDTTFDFRVDVRSSPNRSDRIHFVVLPLHGTHGILPPISAGTMESLVEQVRVRVGPEGSFETAIAAVDFSQLTDSFAPQT